MVVLTPKIVGLLGLVCLPLLAHAHLLNMTKAQVNVAADGSLVVDIEVDLNRAAGGGLEYHRLSLVPEPLADPELRSLLDGLSEAISLQLGTERIPLDLVSARLPAEPEEVFLDPLSWPMTQVQLQGALPSGWQRGEMRLQGVFLPSFRLEEPIALTFFSMPEQRSMTRWLVTSQVSPPFALPGAADSAQAAEQDTAVWQFIHFGFVHILPKGLDHILFVLGLYLGVRSLKTLLLLVTCFTLAHSLTLGLAGVGIVRLPASIVEPLISLSILWIGIENVLARHRTERYRPALVFAFGLLHGLGFASVLSALDAPQGSFLLSLLSFNIGIELGQLAVIAMALALTWRWRNRLWYRRAITVPASLAIALIASIWTLQRIL